MSHGDGTIDTPAVDTPAVLGATTEDLFLGGKLRLRQPATGYRAGLDAVMLAAAVPIDGSGSSTVLDAGAGVGTAGLCLAIRCPAVDVTLVERTPVLAALARGNIELNGLGARVRVIEADLREPAASLEALGLRAASFEHVIANPPYNESGRGRPPRDAVEAGANEMAADDLDLWIKFLTRMAAAGGALTMIHRADALARLLDTLEGRFGAVEILPLHPRMGEPAHRIVLRARKGSRAPLSLKPGLVLHGDGNGFVPVVERVLREGAALPWDGRY